MYKSRVNDNAVREPTECLNRQQMLAAADLCVKCGLCLPYCPTYRLAREEGDSPRGRIALIQGIAGGQLEITTGVIRHLEGCLTCRVCERVCPSLVGYGHLVDRARNLTRKTKPASRRRRLLRWFLAEAMVQRPWLSRLLVLLLRRFEDSVVDRVLRKSNLGSRLGVSRLVSYRPSLEPYRGWLDYYPAQGLEKGRVSLFLGCVARAIDRPVMEAAIQILTRLGYGVKIPPDQGCCGALYAHDGEARDALRLAGRNLDAFSADPVLTTASGCAAQLLEYPFLEGITAERRNQALAFASRISDISRFLADREWPDGLDIRPLPARVVVHEPCSLRNVMRQQSGPYELLARIPGLEVVPLAENPACCGAAGTHMFEHGSMADGLGDEMCDAVAATGAEMLVTSNVGCALHLSSRLRRRGSRVRVMHPVVLLAGQVKWDS